MSVKYYVFIIILGVKIVPVHVHDVHMSYCTMVLGPAPMAEGSNA